VPAMDPRSPYESTETTPADLQRLLTEDDREDLELSTPLRQNVARDADDIDARILAALVTF
jgi:hypothetical protein